MNETGLLPQGIHNCSVSELRARFGIFQTSDRRPRLMQKLEAFLAEAKASRIVRAVIVNGSFVTSKEDPNDIDLIIVVAAEHDFRSDLKPTEYNVLSKQRVRRRFGFDLLVAREGSIEYVRWTEFFEQVRLEPDRRKGILELRL